MRKSNKPVGKPADTKVEWIESVILCAAPLVFMVLFHLLKITDEANVKLFMRLSLMAVAGCGGYLAYKGRLDAARAVTLIIIAGVIIRTGYSIYTDPFVRAHDIDGNSPTGVGHWAYLYRVFNRQLPDTNIHQFYHPPLFHIIAAAFIRIALLLTGGGNDMNRFLYLAVTVSCISSCVMLIAFTKLMDEFGISKRIQIIPIALTAFYPTQILAAGRMNNDMLVFMFMVLALYFTLKWHKKQKLKYIIGIAVTIGCGMMTKINGALIAFVSGPVMIYHFAKRIQSKDEAQVKNIVIQLAVFAVIVFPLGLWYAVRNYRLFGQPLTYVLDLGPNVPSYTGGNSFFERWIKIPFAQYPLHPFTYDDTTSDINVWSMLIKTGVHGDFNTWTLPVVLAWLINYVHAALMVMALVAIVFEMIKDRAENICQKRWILAIWLMIAVSYISFNISYPATHTADFRYVFLGQIAAAAFIGYFTDYCFRNREKRAYKILFCADMAVVLLFCALSILHMT